MEVKVQEISIYTDGACKNNPGPGGWAAILLCDGKEREISGGVKATTNNRMEMTAVIEALRCLTKPSRVQIFSDSAYIVNCWLQGWYLRWQRNGWHTADKRPVENRDLWQEMLKLAAVHKVEFIKVKGHSNNLLNNRCDQLAREAVPFN